MMLLSFHIPCSLFVMGLAQGVLALPNPQLSSKELEGRAYSINNNSPFRKPWPKGNVLYCFNDDAARDTLQSVWDAGWNIWDQIPVRPQAAPGLENRVCGQQRGGILAISCNSDQMLASTVGFLDSHNPHSLTFDCKTRAGTGDVEANMAHEIGHILGLYHEHQKPDANLKVKCENLRDYDLFKSAGHPMDMLCSSHYAASNAGFSAGNILPIGGLSDVFSDGPVDFNSIMIYGSNFGGKQAIPVGNQRYGPRRNVLVRQNGDTFGGNKVPSQRDIDRVRALYGNPGGAK